MKNNLKVSRLVVCLAVMACATFGLRVPAQRPMPIVVAPKITKDVVYGSAALPTPDKPPLQLKLDIYEPQGFRGRRPGVLMAHGGGWVFGDKAEYAKFGTALAEKGYVAFSINYRLLPTFPHPAQIDDAQRAMRWIRVHAADYNLDPKRIGALGDSAGGHLVSLLGTWDTRDNSAPELAKFSSKANCVVDLYGPSDFTVPATQTTAQGLQLITLFFGGKTQEQAMDTYREGSPVAHVDRHSAPFLIMHGDKDPLVPISQSERLNKALKDAKVESTLVVFPNEGHGFTTAADQEKRDQLALAFLKKHLRP